ncbi:uncharacterized protein LOC141844819 [Curcuma longa]|uniref:uncharacterized protein LOC141844819 n=1 Tax=Curcuma longa TaxID=136217 RepID=UPI003D9F3FC8
MASSSRRTTARVLLSASAAADSSPLSASLSHRRSSSPTRLHLAGSAPSAKTPSFRFALERSSSPRRSLAAVDRRPAPVRRTCMCSPTTHPGSFRCSLHKGLRLSHHRSSASAAAASNRLNARRSAMTNSLVRIGAVEGEWVRRALAALIRPSSHQQRRREDFRPRPTRLSVMSTADDR